jgi:hypothetical protein
MFDELLENMTDRPRHRSGSSGGVLGRLAQLLGGGEADERHDTRRPHRTDDRRDGRYDDDVVEDDDRDEKRGRKRRDFDFDLGD